MAVMETELMLHRHQAAFNFKIQYAGADLYCYSIYKATTLVWK